MFEAGALSKDVVKFYIIPFLFGIVATDITGPLSEFQAAPFDKEEIRKILKTLNSALEEASLELSVLNSVFEKWWPDLESKVFDPLEDEKPQGKVVLRSERDLLEEILKLVRSSYYRYPLLSLDQLNLSEKIRIRLKNMNMRYIGELIQLKENDLLRPAYRFEKNDIFEIKQILLERGLDLGIVF